MVGSSTVSTLGRGQSEPQPYEASARALNKHDGRQYVAPPVDISRVVQKPVPRIQRESPREFQIQQVKRRFSAAEKHEDGRSTLFFRLTPSDPDFPFEMDGLDCVLHVPEEYPKTTRPSLEVKNKEMGRGFQINIERGFDALVERLPRATLLSLINALDKQLEALLTEQKAETIKIIPNAPKASVGIGIGSESQQRSQDHAQVQSMGKHKLSEHAHTPEQLQVAQVQREAEIRQVQARLGRLRSFAKSSDGLSFTIPFTPRRPEQLPVPLQAVQLIKLIVPRYVFRKISFALTRWKKIAS